MWSFPKRYRNDRDPIITVPRGRTRLVPLMQRFSGRSCWYYRLDPASGRPQLFRCQDAMELMRAERVPGPTLRIPPTAERLGLINLGDTRQAQRKREQAAAASPAPAGSP